LTYFTDDFQKHIWETKYKHNKESFDDFCKRVAYNIFEEGEDRDKLYKGIKGFKQLMGGRINSNIGLPEEGLTLTNCFILPTNDDPDSLASIMDTLKDFVLTLKSEGGVGFCADFLRPANTLIKGVGVTTPGSVKFLEGFDKMSDIITAGGVDKNNSFQGVPTKNSIRKGAMMITMSINHPDIEDFIIAKSTPNKLTRCNMSVLVSDKFIKTVEEDGDWDLWFPDIRSKEYEQWNGDMLKWEAEGYSKVIYKTVKARDLWELLLKNCFNRNEPGILFIDNIRKMDNLAYLNECSITCTNPCLPPWATVLTPEGISTIGKIKQGDLIWSEDGWVKVINKQSSGIKDVYEYGTSSTDSFFSTKEHRISSNNKKIEIDKAISIDKFQKEGDNYVRNCLSCDIKNKKYISTEEVFDITVNGNHHTFWCNGYNVFNCGEVPSSTGKINNELVGDICNLGSINLTKFYNIETRKFDVEGFLNSAELMVKALDRIIDISKYPLPLYERGAKLKRKVGVGLMGVGSLAMMMNMRYGSQEHLYFLEDLLSKYINKLYQTSALLAKKYGTFPAYDKALLDIGFVANSGVLWAETIDLIKKYGLRNSALMAEAPNGTLSILAGNVSGGVEPVFDKEFYRWNRVEEKVDFEYPKVSKGEWFETDYFKEQTTGNETILMSKDNKYRIDKNVGLCKQIKIEDYGYKIAKQQGFTNTATAKELSIDEHLKVLALFSKYCDQSISKTISLPKDLPFEDFKRLYKDIYSYGIKGCTVYREGTSVAILESQKADTKKSVKKQQKEFLEAFKDQSDKVAINVKLPDEYPSKGYILRSEGKKWYLHVAFKDKACTRPFALFVNTNSREDNISTFNALDNLIELAKLEGLDNTLLLETEKKIVNQKNPVKVCRMLGFLLRHNVNIYKIVKALDNVEEAVVGTFIHRIKKFLSQFIEEINEMNKCPYCGENSLVFREGCFICLQCGMSKC